MISLVRHEAKKHGFNICIPRGDTILGDGTEQVTLYCDKYGLKRRRIQDCKERFSKKTNCKWKVKFQKRAGARYYELVKTPNNVHNHQLNQCLIGHAKFSKRRHDFDEFDKASRKRLNTTENPEITNFPDLTHQENDIILESSYLIDKVKNDQDSLKFKSNLKPIKEPCTISFNFQPKRIYHPTYFSPEANKAFQLNNRIPQHQSNYYDNQDIAKCENYNDIKNENAKFIEEDPKHLSQGSSLYSSNNSNQDACENVSDNQNPNEEDENEENLLDIKSMIDNEKLTFTQSDAIDGFKKVTIPKEFQCEMATQSLFDANDHWCVESTANQENENQYFYESNAKEDDSFNNLLHDFDNDSTNDLSHINYKR